MLKIDMHSDKTAQIRNKVAHCISLAETMFGITLPHVDIKFNLRGKVAGLAKHIDGKFYLQFNSLHMRLGGKTWEHLLNATVPHEVAHLVCFAFPRYGKDHDTGWQNVCICLGGNGSELYSVDDAPEAFAMYLPYAYTTTTGSICKVSAVTHRKIQKGLIFRCQNSGGLLTRDRPVTHLLPPTTKVASTNVQSRASQIRELIQSGVDEELIIDFAMSVWNMRKTTAILYYRQQLTKIHHPH